MLDHFEHASIVVLGSGTSVGVPMIGCNCKVCRSDDPRDNRLRPSVLLRLDEHRVLIDTAPDFRCQALRYGIERLDAILYTHAHADHILGLDDVRPFNFMQKGGIPIFGSSNTLKALERTFQYVFDDAPSQSTRPRLVRHDFREETISLFGLQFEPIPVFHGNFLIHGFRFGDCAYLTDHSDIPDDSMEKLRGWTCCFLTRCGITHTRPIRQSINRSERLKSSSRDGRCSRIFLTTYFMQPFKPRCLRTSASPTMA